MVINTPVSNEHRRSRRAMFKALGTGAVAAAFCLPGCGVFTERSAPPAASHEHWNMVVNHASRHLAHEPERGADWLKSWIATMLKEPRVRISALSLVGPQTSGKTTFHYAVGTLLPRISYASTDNLVVAHKLVEYGDTPLVVYEGSLSESPRLSIGASLRRAKCRVPTAYEGGVGFSFKEIRNVSHFMEVRHTPREAEDWFRQLTFDELRRPIPQRDLLRRLEDEQDAFLHSLENASRMSPV